MAGQGSPRHALSEPSGKGDIPSISLLTSISEWAAVMISPHLSVIAL